MSESTEEINERLINEYISKVGCCDECFASIYCTVNGLRESRTPQDYCVKNIKSYFGDKANLMESGKELQEIANHLRDRIKDVDHEITIPQSYEAKCFLDGKRKAFQYVLDLLEIRRSAEE